MATLTYARPEDIYNVFGRTTVRAWADVENTQLDSEIDGRLSWALNLSYNHINDLLRRGPYAIPMCNPPATIVDICGRHAGVLLFDNRRISDQDNDQVDPVNVHRTMVDEIIRKILAGIVRLELATQAVDYPTAIPGG